MYQKGDQLIDNYIVVNESRVYSNVVVEHLIIMTREPLNGSAALGLNLGLVESGENKISDKCDMMIRRELFSAS